MLMYSQGQIASKLKYLRELRDSGELNKLYKHGLVSHTSFNFLEAHDLYEIHAKVCPDRPVKATSEIMGLTTRRIRQILFGQ